VRLIHRSKLTFAVRIDCCRTEQLEPIQYVSNIDNRNPTWVSLLIDAIDDNLIHERIDKEDPP
jgi:hypothetical protein